MNTTPAITTMRDASEPSGSQQRVVGGLSEIFERAKGAVTEHCRTGMKPEGRSVMYSDCLHKCLDDLRAHLEKPSNADLSEQPPGK